MASKRGSAAVEAAMVFPLVILLVAVMISAGLELYGRVERSSAGHREAAAENVQPSLTDTGEILRMQWLLSK